MPIFQDANGFSIKFFIQKNLPEEVQAELCETVTALGGRVETKVPRQGYILVQNGTAEESRLRLCWTSAERPDRYFVPYTYVEACKIAGMLLKQIFIENGAPITMHIHPSIANPNARSALSQRIMHSGGDPNATAQSARVILADPNTDVFQHLIKTYQGEPDKYIESYLWVKKCVERGSVLYTPLVYKNPGGRRPGEDRTQFTEDDEGNLANWIATKIPYKETGGRTGNRLYQQLCDMKDDPQFAWVSRHTWQSWRERYKKNATRLDGLIALIVDQKKPAQGEKGQYGYVRQPEEKPKKRKRKSKNKEVSYLDDEFIVGSSKMEGMGMGMFQGTAPLPLQALGEMEVQLPGAIPQLPGIVFEGTPAGPSMTTIPDARPAEEEDDGSEWAVRVGNSPPPAWGKRRASADPESMTGVKRPRPNEPFTPPEAEPMPSTSNDMHVVDQAIRQIAVEFQFTVEEVQAHYDRCGEMGLTRARFEAMRALLVDKFPDDV